MGNYEVFDLGDVILQCGIILPRVKLAYKTYGKLFASGDNAILLKWTIRLRRPERHFWHYFGENFLRYAVYSSANMEEL